jgi:hypothetical protein
VEVDHKPSRRYHKRRPTPETGEVLTSSSSGVLLLSPDARMRIILILSREEMRGEERIDRKVIR